MAYEMKIRGTEQEVKVRNPWAVALLPIITLGIYHLVWWYKINKELKAYGEAKGYDLGQNPTNSVLALFPGGIIVIPALITYWRGTKRVMGASRWQVMRRVTWPMVRPMTAFLLITGAIAGLQVFDIVWAITVISA